MPVSMALKIRPLKIRGLKIDVAGGFAEFDDPGRATNCFSRPVGDGTKGVGQVAQLRRATAVKEATAPRATAIVPYTQRQLSPAPSTAVVARGPTVAPRP
jgi:hypothetical protein